jgi:HTH-type transcriptional regulator/antitoxin HigA
MKARTITKTKNLEARELFFAIRAADEYDAAVARLNALVDEISDNPKDPRYRVVETLSVLIESYDREHHSLPEASAVEVIRFLMELHGLTQKDLPEIGSQGVVSEVLAGRRQLNLRQIKALAARFGVDAGYSWAEKSAALALAVPSRRNSAGRDSHCP